MQKQSYLRGINVSVNNNRRYRTFEEMSDYEFSYNSRWKDVVLSDKDGNPYKFYLEREPYHPYGGRSGRIFDIVSEVQDAVTKLNNIYRKVIRITE